MLEATARKQGESDGDQDGAASDHSLLASSADQVIPTPYMSRLPLPNQVIVRRPSTTCCR